jgi:hypothetical protein
MSPPVPTSISSGLLACRTHRALDQRAPEASSLQLRQDRHVLDLDHGFVMTDQLDVADDPAGVVRDQHVATRQVLLELCGRVLRELEQVAKLFARTGVKLDRLTGVSVRVEPSGREFGIHPREHRSRRPAPQSLFLVTDLAAETRTGHASSRIATEA